MADLRNYGDRDHPLRPSSLDALTRCPLQAALKFLGDSDTSGAAADTGSMTHAAVAAWHNNDKSVEAALTAIADSQDRFPLGDAKEAARFFTDYESDPRNQDAKVVAVEYPVECMLPAHPSDATKQPIYIRGTLDQIRETPDGLKVFDLKTGAPDGWRMIHEHAFQQSAYAICATQTFGVPVAPGALIRAQGYRKRGGPPPQDAPPGVFFWMPWSLDDCYLLLDSVRLIVAQLRAGIVPFGPGTHCSFCPQKGIDTCLPEAKSRFNLTMTV